MLHTKEPKNTDQDARSGAGITLPPVDNIVMLRRPFTSTEERSDTRDATRTSTYGILRPTSASDVYRVGRYYVGLLKELPPPANIYDDWNESICGQLINHLLAVTGSLPDDIPDEYLIVEPVLCMAGKRRTMRLNSLERHARGMVMLEPMVWIHCGSRRCKRKVKDSIHKATFLRNFLQRFDMAEAYIALEAPWPAAHIVSTSEQQYSSASDERIVSVSTQARTTYGRGYYPEQSYFDYPEQSYSPGGTPRSIYSARQSSHRRRPRTQFGRYDHSQGLDYPRLGYPARLPSQRVRGERRGGADSRTGFPTGRYTEYASNESYVTPSRMAHEVYGRQLTLAFDIQCQSTIRSACGIRAKFSIHDSNWSLSTIGGLIVVDDAVFGLTTAHGIVSCLAASKTPPSSGTDEETSDSNSESEPSSPIEPSGAREKRHVYSTTRSIITQGIWSPIPMPKVLSYKGRGTLSGDYTLPTQSPPTSDFALVDLDTDLVGDLKNTYRDPSTSVPKEITGSLCNNQLSTGEVLVITSSNSIPGYLLDGTGTVVLRGTAMRTRKIQITIPQGWKRTQRPQQSFAKCHTGEGISGAWVVRDRMVCGCIFAAYSTGRYLHMLPIEDIFRSISQFTNAASVRVATSDDLGTPTQPPVEMVNSTSFSALDSCRLALDRAENCEDGNIDPATSQILEAAIADLWKRIQDQPTTYTLTSDEFALFNYFIERFSGNPVAHKVVARYWHNIGLTSPSSASEHPPGPPDDSSDAFRLMNLEPPGGLLQTTPNIPSQVITAATTSTTVDPRIFQSYKIQSHPHRFFRQGRVFSVIWHENPGHDSQITDAPSFTSTLDGTVSSHFRMMVVVKEFSNSAWCFAINTYDNQGVPNSGANASKHAIIYTEGSRPMASPGEPQLLRTPLEIRLVTADYKISPMSRLNFAKLFTVEHNVKVRPIGKLTERSMPAFLDYARREVSI